MPRCHYPRIINAMIVQDRAFFLGLSPHAHPVIVQVPHGSPELFGVHLNELQRPNRLIRFSHGVPAARVSSNHKEKRAKKQTREYSSFHGLPPRLNHASFETHGNPKSVSSPTHAYNGYGGGSSVAKRGRWALLTHDLSSLWTDAVLKKVCMRPHVQVSIWWPVIGALIRRSLEQYITACSVRNSRVIPAGSPTN